MKKKRKINQPVVSSSAIKPPTLAEKYIEDRSFKYFLPLTVQLCSIRVDDIPIIIKLATLEGKIEYIENQIKSLELIPETPFTNPFVKVIKNAFRADLIEVENKLSELKKQHGL